MLVYSRQSSFLIIHRRSCGSFKSSSLIWLVSLGLKKGRLCLKIWGKPLSRNYWCFVYWKLLALNLKWFWESLYELSDCCLLKSSREHHQILCFRWKKKTQKSFNSRTASTFHLASGQSIQCFPFILLLFSSLLLSLLGRNMLIFSCLTKTPLFTL